MEETIKNLQNQVNSLQKKVIDLENQILVKEGKLNMLPEAPISDEKASLTSQQGDSTLKVKKDDSRTGTPIKVGEPMNKESDRLSAQ